MIVLTLLAVTLLAGRNVHCHDSHNRSSIVDEDHKYAVVFDAGSTGSRVSIFTFVAQPKIKIVDNHFKEVHPGLSNYSANPSLAAQSLQTLVDFVTEKVPQSLRHRTPLVLKA